MKNLFLAGLLLFSFDAFAKEVTVLAEFNKLPTFSLIKKVSGLNGVIELKRFDNTSTDYFSRLYEVRLAEETVLQLKNLKEVKRVEQVYLAEAFSLTPASRGFSSDSFSAWQWGLMNQGQDILQDLDDINSQTLTGVSGFDLGVMGLRAQLPSLMKKNVLVAVLDSGVDIDHEDLKGNIYRNTPECKNGELPYGLLTDKDGNGLAGDCMGWNFVNNNNRPYDEKGHGTHVAGIVAAVSDNGKGISGLVPSTGAQIKILPVKVYQGAESLQDNAMVAFTDKVAKGILYAIKMKADVVNLSLGWPKIMDTEYLRQAVALAQKSGVTIVAAAGNNGHARPLYPCSYDGVICVGATTVTGEAASFSNYGTHVDIAAPGEQILSTFPKKLEPSFFSAQGYEIKNGTSQAAPFVSASVAVLKSIYPGISEDEIYARLLSSARPISGDKYFLSGALQLEKAINVTPSAFVLPVFKNLSLAHFKMKSRSFELDIPFKNFGEDFAGGELRIELQHPSIHLAIDSFAIPSLAKGQATLVHLVGHLEDARADAHLKMNLRLTDAMGTRTFVHELLVVRDLQDDPFLKKVVLENKGFNNEIALLLKQGMLSKLRTIEDPFRKTTQPEYYFDRIEPVSKRLELWIFKEQDGVFAAFKAIIPEGSRIGTVRRLDLNYDGQPDYFVESKSAKSTARIIYSFLDRNLAPMFGVGHFFYDVKESYASPNKMAFVSKQTSFGPMALPVFIEQGLIPEQDKNPDVWNPEAKELKLRAYYFEPNFTNSTLNLRLIDSYLFDKRLETELGKTWEETREFLGQGADAGPLVYQSQNDLQNGRASFLFSVGVSNLKRSYEVTFASNLNLSFKQIDLNTASFENDIRLSLTRIDGDNVQYQAGSAFAGLQNAGLGHMTFVDSSGVQELRYDHFSMRDSIVAPMGAYLKDGKYISFYQTKSNLIGVDSDSQVKAYPIERVSFITGQAFNELYYPVVVASEPAFYVDATRIHSGHVFLVKESAEGFVSPMKSNVFIPNSCSAMNPVNYQGQESFAFLCSEGNTLVMNYLSLF